MKTAKNAQAHVSSVVVLDKDRGLSPSSGNAYEHALLRELFAYTANWSRRFYRGRQNHDKQKIAEEFVLRALAPDPDTIETSPSTLSSRLHEFIATHLHQGLTLKDISKHFGYSEKYCSDFFILHVGEPFSAYLKRIRLQTAKCLLESSEQNLTEIAQAIGFQDQFAFSHFFKRATGIPPRSFRETRLRSSSRT